MTSRADVVAWALAQNGKFDGVGYPGTNSYSPDLGRPQEFWCFAAGTLVATPDGLREIQTLQVGDPIYSGALAEETVERVLRRQADVVALTAFGVDGTLATAEHPYWARRRLPGRTAAWSDPQWIPAGELSRGDLIAQPTFEGGREAFDVHHAYLLGRYLADGWGVLKTSKVNAVERVLRLICCAHDETEDLRKRIQLSGLRFKEYTKRTVTEFIFSRDAAALFAGAGEGAMTKRVPWQVFSWAPEERAALLHGYLDGDGSVKGGVCRASTVSRQLAHGIAILARSLGYAPVVYAYDRDDHAWIEGRLVHQARTRYEVHYRSASEWRQGRQHRVEDGVLWAPVRSVEPAGATEVFNVTVSGEHTFIADGCVTHNCGDFVTDAFKVTGDPLKSMQPGCRTGFAYCPDAVDWARANGAAKHSWQALPADIILFDWNGDGTADHTALVERYTNGQLFDIGGDSGPSNVDNFRGQGGVHRHVYSAPEGAGNPQILLVVDAAKATLNGFSTSRVKPKPVSPAHPATLMLKTPMMHGTAVSVVQTALNRSGAHLVVDGVFGQQTRTAVMHFQLVHHLAADGIVGPLTHKALGA